MLDAIKYQLFLWRKPYFKAQRLYEQIVYYFIYDPQISLSQLGFHMATY